MTTLPDSTDFTGATVTEGQFKTAMTSLRAFISEQLGVTGGNSSGAFLRQRKNLLINGGFDIWQRGTARTYLLSSYHADRWAEGQAQAGAHEKIDISSDTSILFSSALRSSSSSVAEAASGTRMTAGQLVESVNCAHLAGQTVTLSYWIRFSAATQSGTTGGFYSAIGEYDSADPVFASTGATRQSTNTLANGSYPTSWTKISHTVTTATTMKNLSIRFLLSGLLNTTSSSDFYYDITGVQLEAGSIATDFEYRAIGQELSLCQRYYESSDMYIPDSAALPTNWFFKASKRASPTISGGNAGYATFGTSTQHVAHRQTTAAAATVTAEAEL